MSNVLWLNANLKLACEDKYVADNISCNWPESKYLKSIIIFNIALNKAPKQETNNTGLNLFNIIH